MSKTAMKLALEALKHCKDAIVERGLNGNPEFAEKWGLTLPLERSEEAITALEAELAAPSTWTLEDGLRHQDIRVEMYPPHPTSGMVVGMSKGVRLIHIPTGTTVESDTERSQHRNRDVALKKLEAALAEQPAQQQEPVGTYGEIFESMRFLLRSGRQADQQIYMAMQCKPLYTSPPAQRKPLTDMQVDGEWILVRDLDTNDVEKSRLFARAIEAAHGIKENT